ncbi:hypothetical protein RvY_19184 [Ramazzottius varieornatus]|uniref:Uncharacterized protein n=1 Tax=Ramazzottius varieornatus TaxID=947166 RepID=A0A1D1W8M1_RAMVA|nr:hypothetical protein RvY_19184 [Ramazzottius varieornatus]
MALTQQIAMKDGRGRISVHIPYEGIWNPKSDESPLLYQNALDIRVTFEYVHEASTTYITPTVPEFPSLEQEGKMASDFMKLYRTKEGADFGRL